MKIIGYSSQPPPPPQGNGGAGLNWKTPAFSSDLRLCMHVCVPRQVVRADDLAFKESGVKQVLKDVFLPWYHAYRMFVQCATTLEVCAAVHRIRHNLSALLRPLLDLRTPSTVSANVPRSIVRVTARDTAPQLH